MKRILDKIQVSSLALSSVVTSIIVILIIIFLFKEGISFFNKRPLEEGLLMLTNKNNPVTYITPAESKLIFDREIDNWKPLTGHNIPIQILTLDEIEKNFTEEQMGANMEYLDTCYNQYIKNNTGALAIIPEKYYSKNINANQLRIDKNSITQFIKTKEWFPTSKPVALFGALPLLFGTFLVSIGAILFALPFGIACAIYMSEVMKPTWRKWMKPIVELLAGIPSVVYGFFGLVVIVPFIQKIFHLDVGETALSGSILLGIMALPTIITISEDAIRNVPKTMREASLAMGATKWQTIYKVIIPYAKSGITTAIMLGIGRAIGETMAVLMVTGNAANTTINFLKPVRTIPATIAAELGEAPVGGMHYQALFTLGCLLFLITMCINVFVNFISKQNN